MKKSLIIMVLSILSWNAHSQIGFNCQYVPGVQFGFTSVKTDGWGKYKYGAGLATMMIDRMTSKWYSNLDMNSLYYSLTQINRGKYAKIAKNEGGLFAGRLGRVFGKSDDTRFGFYFGLGMSQSNIDSVAKVTFESGGVKSFWNYGLGLLAYKKIGRLHAMAKVGYDIWSWKKTNLKGGQIILEGTVGYKLYQKYGISVMPCFYIKSFTFDSRKTTGTSTNSTPDKGKSSTFVLRLGLTKFF